MSAQDNPAATARMRFGPVGEVDVLHLRREDVRIEQIAHSLAGLYRYNGQPTLRQSVCAHSCLTSELMALEVGRGPAGKHSRYECLMHDFVEALGLGDLPSPIKALCKDYQRIEQHVRRTVAPWFGLAELEPSYVRKADQLAYRLERAALFGLEYPAEATSDMQALVCWSIGGKEEFWESEFLSRYYELRPS